MAAPGPARQAAPRRQGDAVGGNEQQAEEVGKPRQQQCRRVRGQPAAAPASPGVDHADEQVARDAGQRRLHRERPRILAEPAHRRHRGEDESRRQPGPWRHQPPPQHRHDTGGSGHRQRRREPCRQLASAGEPHHGPHQHVVGAVHGVLVAHQAEHVRERPAGGGKGGGLVTPVGGDLDPPQRHRQGDRRRQQGRPALGDGMQPGMALAVPGVPGVPPRRCGSRPVKLRDRAALPWQGKGIKPHVAPQANSGSAGAARSPAKPTTECDGNITER